MQCDDVVLHLAQTPELDDRQLPLPVRHHLGFCLGCQAERSHYRRIHRELQALRQVREDPGPHLLDQILDSVRPPAPVTELHPGRRRAYVGGLAAAATAGAAGVVVLVSKLNGRGQRLLG